MWKTVVGEKVTAEHESFTIDLDYKLLIYV